MADEYDYDPFGGMDASGLQDRLSRGVVADSNEVARQRQLSLPETLREMELNNPSVVQRVQRKVRASEQRARDDYFPMPELTPGLQEVRERLQFERPPQPKVEDDPEPEVFQLEGLFDLEEFEKSFGKQYKLDHKFWTKIAVRSISMQNSLAQLEADLGRTKAFEDVSIDTAAMERITRMYVAKEICKHLGVEPSMYAMTGVKTDGGLPNMRPIPKVQKGR